MHEERKFKTTEDFITWVTEAFSYTMKPEELSRFGINKDSEGNYSEGQFWNAYGEIRKKYLDDLFPFEEGTPLRIDLLKACGRTTMVESYDFALLLLADEFQSFIKNIREMFMIDETPLYTLKRIEHFKKVTQDFYQRGWFIKGESHNQITEIMLWFIDLWLEHNTRFSAKDPSRQGLWRYLVYEYIFTNDPFSYLSDIKEETDKLPSYGIITPRPFKALDDGCIELRINIYSGSTQEEVKSVIDAAWPYIKKTKDKELGVSRIKRAKDGDLLIKKWRAYHMHKFENKNYKQIGAKLRISDHYARKFVSDISKELKRITNTSPLR